MNNFPEKITEIVKQDLSRYNIVTDAYWVAFAGEQLSINLQENFRFSDGLDDGHPHKYEISLGFMLHNNKPRWVINRNTMPDIGQDKVQPISWSEYWREIASVIDSTLEILVEYLDEWIAYEAHLADKARQKADKVKTFWDGCKMTDAQKRYMDGLLRGYLRNPKDDFWFWPRGRSFSALMTNGYLVYLENGGMKATFSKSVWNSIKAVFGDES